MQVNRRTIRLKEWNPGVDRFLTPTLDQLHLTDGSLSQARCRLRTNEDGFIRTGNLAGDGSLLESIVLLGDSFVESMFMEEQKRFASQLERLLLGSKLQYQILNGGRSGSTLIHSFNVFLNKIIPILPRVAHTLLFTSMSDHRAQITRDSYWMKDEVFSPIVDHRYRGSIEDRRAASGEQRNLLEAFVEVSRQFDHEPTIVLTPFRSSGFYDDSFMINKHSTYYNFKKMLNRYTLINETARGVAYRLGVRVLDAAQELRGDPQFFYDSVHLNERGHSEMAKFLKSELGS